MGKNHLTVNEAANYLGVKVKTIYNISSNGEIPKYKSNRKMTFFLKKDLDKYIFRNRVLGKLNNYKKKVKVV